MKKTKRITTPKKIVKARPKKVELLAQNLDTFEEVSLYYGFKPITAPKINRDDLQKAKSFSENFLRPKMPTGVICRLEEKIALLRMYREENWANEIQPIQICFNLPFPQEKKTSHPKTRRVNFGLEVMNTTRSVAEALLIEAAIATLKEEGFTDLQIEINSLGNTESANLFSRELAIYYRKHLADLPATCRQKFKQGPFEVLTCTEHESCKRLSEAAPQAISFLNEGDRLHFKEILEFLETLEIPYQIKNSLLNSNPFEHGTIFAIREGGTGPYLAYGTSYDGLVRKMGIRRDLPGCGIAINYERKNKGRSKSNHKIKAPKIFYIQLGFEAKRKSLKVIEVLRQAKIPVYQSISRDKLSGQFSAAEKMGVPYIIIMGQKEAMEESVIVRNVISRSQETVPIDKLAHYLKKTQI